MKTTNNLGLKKIELTDSPPDITVQDFNWDIIDHTLKEHEVEIDKANSQLAQKANTSDIPTAATISGTIPISKGGTGQTTAALARNALGLGNTTGALPLANGGTGATTAATALTALGAAPLASPIFTGTPTAPAGTDYATLRLRNMQASTTDLTAGTSALANGAFYVVYE